jgi:hypothetical protein
MSKSQPTPEQMAKRVARHRDTGDGVARRFGQHTREAMAGIGVRFGD